MLDRHIEAFCEQNRIYRFDGERGVENLVTILRAIGYNESPYQGNSTAVLVNFLADNSGATEAIINWIGEQNVPEWKEKLEAVTDTTEEYDDED